MSFDPLDQPGIAVADQFRNWSEMSVAPFDKREVDPYTRTRVILMNGIEVEAALFSHQFARHTDDIDLKRALAANRRVDQQQQKSVNGLNPGDQTPLETTLGHEQVAVDLTAWLARHEPDPAIRDALDFALLEDFDHLYRYANLFDLLYGGHADDITRELTEIMPGRSTYLEHADPHDGIRRHFDTFSVDPLSRMHVMTITAAEQQTMNFYMNHGAGWIEPIARDTYSEIAMIEEQHVSHYESLLDPLDTWIASWVFHEYNEVYLYWSMLSQETDRRIAGLWELFCNFEIGQLQVACDHLRRYEGREPAEILPRSLPDTPVTFEPNKDYVRGVLATQIELRTDGLDYVPVNDLPDDHRYFRYQALVNAEGSPTESIIDAVHAQKSHEYRFESGCEHPVESLRSPVPVVT